MGCFFQKVLQVFKKPFHFSFFSIPDQGIDLDYCDIEWFALEMKRDHSVTFKIASKYRISDFFVDYDRYSIYSKGFLPTVVDIMFTCIKFTHSSPFYFTDSYIVNIYSCHLLFDHFQFALIHGPNIPGSYTILLFIASDLSSITSLIHNWELFLLWLCLFNLSGVISPLISSSILGTYRCGEFIFQFPIFLPFHTIHAALKARILKWFAIPFSSGPHFVRTLHHDQSILDGPTWHGLQFH